MKTRITVSGVGGLRKATGKVRERLEAELSRAVADEVAAIEGDARRRVRVDSGDLRRAIQGRSEGLRGDVEPRPERSEVSAKRLAIKANVNEFGSQRDPGQPYMTPAAEAAHPRWPKRAAEAIKRAVDG